MFDVITIGSSSVDVFIKTRSSQIDFGIIRGQEDVCLPIGSKILIDEMHTSTGGGGTNSAVSFSRLGLKTAWLGVLGRGNNSKIIKDILKNEKIVFLGKEKEGDSGFSVILTNLKKNRTVLAYKGVNNDLDLKDIKKNSLKTDWFYCSSMLGKSWSTMLKIVSSCKAKVAFNPSTYLAMKGVSFLSKMIKRSDILILNKEEAKYLIGSKEDDVVFLLKKIHKLVPLLVITDGANGAYCFDGNKMLRLVPFRSKVVETTGAGDAFASAFIAAFIKGKPIDLCLQWGHAQAVSVISYLGAKEKLLNKFEIIKSRKSKVVVL
jgi:ribokinase